MKEKLRFLGLHVHANFEDRASSSRAKHEGESSFALCDRLSRTRDSSQRQLPTDHDYAVLTREYQTDQSSPKTAPATARSVLEKKQRQLQKHPHRLRRVDSVTPYQGLALIEFAFSVFESTEKWDEQVFRIGETIPMKTRRSISSRKLHADSPGLR